MLIQILNHMPAWVFALLLTLITLGLLQTRTRSITLARALALPIAMLLLSAYGVLADFGSQAVAMTTWLISIAALTMITARRTDPGRIAWEPLSRRLIVPGSWLPLTLMLAMFAAKTIVGAAVAIKPALAGDTGFMLIACVAFGAINGVLIGRVLPLLSIVRPVPAPIVSVR